MSGRKRASEATNLVPSEAAIDSVQSNKAFRRAIAFIDSAGDPHPPTRTQAKREDEGVHEVEPAAPINSVKVDNNAPICSSNEKPGKVPTSSVLHSAQPNEEAKDEISEEMFEVMPRVKTSGGVPNGVEIEGVLHQFFQGEISIKCVCHGHILSPEEFVQHAGGSDLANAMRYIYVQP